MKKVFTNHWLLNLKSNGLLSFLLFITLLAGKNVFGQTWLASSAVYNSGDGLGYTHAGIGTYYRATSGGTATVNTGLASCNGSTSNIQMGSSLFIFKATINLNGIVIHGNSGTGSSRTLSAIATSSTLNGTYTTVAGSTASGNLSGSQATNVCSPSPMAITFGSTIPAGTFFRVSLSGNAYVASIVFTPACTSPTKTFNVTATANTICSGNSVTICLSGSQSAATYQLYANDVLMPGVTVAGDVGGGSVSFAAQSPTVATTYKVYSTTAGGFCAEQINGGIGFTSQQEVAVNTAPVIGSENLSGATYTQGDVASALSISLSAGTSHSYQWYQNNLSNPVGANSNSYTPSTASIGTSSYFCVASVTACPSATSNTSGDIVVNAPSNPTIVIDTNSTSFDGIFGKQTVGIASASRSFKVSGSLLTDDITVNAPSGFEVSLSSGSGFGSSVTLNQSGGTVNETTVYAHFLPGAATGYSGNVTCESSGAATINIPVSGTGKVPTITIDETALNFSVTGWAASAPQTKSITGVDLDGTISISVSAPFQVHNGDANWSTSASFTPSSGSVSGTLSIRYNPSSGTGDNSSTVSITSTNAAGKSIAVTGKAAPLLTLSSGPSTQIVKAGTAITNVVYTVTGGVTSASASGLPSNVTFNNGSYTISGTPATESSYPAVYGYTVTIVGPSGTSNATANDTIIVKDPNAKKIAYVINTAVSANDTKIRPYLEARYDLTNITIASVNTSYDFSPYDLVVLTEEPASSSVGMRALWGIDKPLLNLKAFATQSNTWAFASATGANAAGSTQVDVISGAETHPIFAGVTISGGKITVLSGVAGVDNGIQGTTYAGGTKLAYISGSTTNVSINEIEIGTDPSTGTPAGVKNEVLQAKYIQIGISNTSFDNVTADGLQLIGNAASYLTTAATPTLTVTNSPQTYTGSPITATVSSNSGGTVSDIKYGGSSTAPTNAGTYAITADVTANGSYSAADDASAGTFTISPAAATAIVTN
jgi:hypothetical protein